MVRLLLIRHAESLANVKRITQGQIIDEPLSELGKVQSQKLADRLKSEEVIELYSSDLKRAAHTAEEISRILGKGISFDKRLREQDHGEESDGDFIKRCKSFLLEVENKSGTIVAVAHGGTNKTILAISTKDRKKGGKIFSEVKQYNTCLNVLTFKDGNWSIDLVNDVSHLNISEITKYE